MKRVGIVLLVAAAVAAISGLGVALAEQSASPSASVTPKLGSPRTRFSVSFAAPANTGRTAVRYEVRASAPPRPGCVSLAFASAGAGGGGARVRVTLIPSGISHWCSGTYRGTVQELVGPSCPPRELCPDFIAIVTIDRLAFDVKAPPLAPSTAAPAFAGLRAASVVCSGGRPGPGQTASYRLSWSAASDRATARSRIVYAVYVSHTPGGEDFSTPTWTTAPGVTSFLTPQLPVGRYYFVVRARDRAGHEDRSHVERQGAGGCAYPGVTRFGR